MKNIKLLLICTLIVFITGCDMFIPIKKEVIKEQAEIIDNIEVKVLYNEEAHVINKTEIPEVVDITVIGSKKDIYLFKQQSPEIVLDLTELKASRKNQRVELKCSNCSDETKYTINPKYVSVKIEEKMSAVETIEYKVINNDIEIKHVELSREEVVIKGSKSTLDKVDSIKAIIDLKNIDLSNKSNYYIDSIKLVAYDQNNKTIDNIEIVPTTVNVNIIIK